MDPRTAQQAACRDHPHPEWWWPTRDVPGDDNHGTQAKRTCAQCPVIRDCLEGALARREEHGIQGGAGEALRRWLRRSWLQGGSTWAQAFEQHLAKLDGDRVPVNMNGPDATHGLAVTYARGCRCDACGLAVMDRDLHLVVIGDRSDATELAAAQAGGVSRALSGLLGVLRAS